MTEVRVGQYSLTVYPSDIKPSDIPECYNVLYKSPFSSGITEDDIHRLIAETKATRVLKCLPNCVECPLALEAAMKAKEMEEEANADKV